MWLDCKSLTSLLNKKLWNKLLIKATEETTKGSEGGKSEWNTVKRENRRKSSRLTSSPSSVLSLCRSAVAPQPAPPWPAPKLNLCWSRTNPGLLICSQLCNLSPSSWAAFLDLSHPKHLQVDGELTYSVIRTSCWPRTLEFQHNVYDKGWIIKCLAIWFPKNKCEQPTWLINVLTRKWTKGCRRQTNWMVIRFSRRPGQLKWQIRMI